MLSAALPNTSKMDLSFFFLNCRSQLGFWKLNAFTLGEQWTLMVAELAVTLFSFFLDRNLGFAQVSPHS